MGDSEGWSGFSAQMCRVWTSDYDCEKISGKEYERIKEEGNYLGGCLFPFYFNKKDGKYCFNRKFVLLIYMYDYVIMRDVIPFLGYIIRVIYCI